MSGSGTRASDAIRRVDWGQNLPHGCEMVDIETKAGVFIQVHVSAEGRSVRVFKRKQGKESHELVVKQGA